MASKKEFKKDINFVFEGLIEAVYIKQLAVKAIDEKRAESLIDSIIESFDSIMAKVNERGVENANVHFKAIRNEFDQAVSNLLDEINK